MDRDIVQQEKVPQNENSAEITLESLAEAVKQMRHQQRRYFATRNPGVLSECKSLERQVDAMIARLYDRQMSPF